MASNLLAMASYLLASDGLHPARDGLHPNTEDGPEKPEPRTTESSETGLGQGLISQYQHGMQWNPET